MELYYGAVSAIKWYNSNKLSSIAWFNDTSPTPKMVADMLRGTADKTEKR